MTDALGDRIKQKYEYPHRTILTQRTNLIVRVDGRAFHSYTRDFARPFDQLLHDAMTEAALNTAKEIGGCKFAYLQSDEVSFFATDYDSHQTEMWFGGNKSKIETIIASSFTAHFNKFMWTLSPEKVAMFDARAFTIPMNHEVINYFLWRQSDATRNSISMLAQHHFSPKQLHGVSTAQMRTMLAEKGIEWTQTPEWFQRGSAIYRQPEMPWLADRAIPYFVENRDFIANHFPSEDDV